MSGKVLTSLPWMMFLSTTVVSVLYALIGLIFVGVLPWQQSAGQLLSEVARVFMPPLIFRFFVVFGALAAVTTTLLSIVMSLSRQFLAATQDGIFPKWFGALNKHGVPYRIIICMGLFSLLPIIGNFTLAFVLTATSAPTLVVSIVTYLPAIIAPGKLPERFKCAWFRLDRAWNTCLSLFSMVSLAALGYTLFTTLDTKTLFGIILFFVGGLMYYVARIRYARNRGIIVADQMKDYDSSWHN